MRIDRGGPHAVGFGLFVIAAALLVGGGVRAKAWKGAEPGKTAKAQVVDKFGAPTRSFSKGGQLSDGISYQGDQAIEGALEADFYFDKHGLLVRIDVFPSQEILQDTIVKIYGKKYAERVTRTGNTYFDFAKDGLVVFFQKDSKLVLSFTFTEPASSSPDGGSR